MVARALNRLQTKVSRRLVRAHSVEALELRKHLATRLCLFRLLSGDVSTDELFRLGNQMLLVVVSALLSFATLFTLDEIIGIVAGVI